MIKPAKGAAVISESEDVRVLAIVCIMLDGELEGYYGCDEF